MLEARLGRPLGRKAIHPKDQERVRRMLQLASEGVTYAEIGRRFNVTRSGSRLLIKRWQEWDGTLTSS